MFKSINNRSFSKHPEATLKALLTISLPLMISSLSWLLMFFFDRLFLAKYSLSALNAAALGSMAANVFCYGMISIVSIAQVFVAKRNGAARYLEASKPVWQMVWFSLMITPLAIALALLLPKLLFHQQGSIEQAKNYFKLLLLFAPVSAMGTAFMSFFLGIERVKILAAVNLIGNFANILFDYFLIFGVKNIIPPLGTTGAGFATGIAQTIQLIIIAALFFGSHNRNKYATADYSFNKTLFWHCIKVALPRAIGQMIDLLAWTVILFLLAKTSNIYISVVSIGQSLILLFAFVAMGLEKATANIFANLMGSKKTYLLGKLIASATKINIIFTILVFIPLVIYKKPLILLFIDYNSQNKDLIIEYAMDVSILVWAYIFLRGIAASLSGILTAYRFTNYILLTNVVTAWAFAVAPTIIFINLLTMSPIVSWIIMDVYVFFEGLLFLFGIYLARNNFYKQNIQ